MIGSSSSLFDQEKLNEALTANDIPGASIARFHGGETTTAAAGIANLNTQVTVDADTMFQIGSITKIFTASLIYRLAIQNKIGIDDPVNKYLPNLQIDDQPTPDDLTVRTLLDYTSGIDGEFFEDFGTSDTALAQYVEACSSLSFVHRPNQLRSYNSTAYCIAGRIVEVITGKPFNEALRTDLLMPLGLERATFFDQETLRYMTAIGHATIDGETDVVDLIMLPACMSAAGSALTMTASDLLQFGIMHLNQGILPNGEEYLPKAAVQDMQTPRIVLPPGKQEVLMGWAALKTSQGKLIVASGQSAGQNSFLILLPEHQYACSILTNSSDGASRLTLTLGFEDLKQTTGAEIQLDQPGPPTDEIPNNLSIYEGIFSNPTKIQFASNGNVLGATTTGVDNGSGEIVSAKSIATPIGGHHFMLAEESQTLGLPAEFLFLNGDSQPPSHFVIGGSRVFGRSE